MVEHLRTARGALVSVLFLKGAGLAERLTEQKKSSIVQAPSTQGGAYITYHTNILFTSKSYKLPRSKVFSVMLCYAVMPEKHINPPH